MVTDSKSQSRTCFPQRLQAAVYTRIFEIVAIATKKSTTYTIKDEQGEVIQGKFYQKELIKVI